MIRDASDDFPILPWFFGALVSHLFHHRDNLKTVIDADAAATLMTVFSVTLIGFGVFGVDWPLPRGVTALLGVVAAYALWPKVRTQPWNW